MLFIIKYNMKLSYIFSIGLTVILILSTSSVYAQNNESKPTNKIQTIELLQHQIKQDDFFNELVGQVKNSFDSDVTFIKVTATFYDKDGTVLNTAFTYTDPQDLPAKSKGSFNMLIGGNIDEIDKYDITITWNGVGSGINVIENLS